ncbi:NAD-dependent epimerase [Herbaspirillum sp. BH-1]|uniref:Uncharacterized protein YbjT (DUF2867 family) n=1 Tax=Herbaspirillum frisingense TaxID=92645 RepID=A0ABU1PLL0_9BURK|nr:MULTISPECIES: SDR family oxidoreductase [Herbaspirillum]MDR6586680.1 uncharacterized protein YbjT (DUF2867 family) [Herbaspirillum frisingense]PLY57360.1 NAD-dependent epimerase [Herbaspirillum sp. BH-1]
MRILVLGATGAIGACTLQALLAEGHEVIGASRRQPEQEVAASTAPWISMDVTQLPTTAQWEAMLEGVELVVNCVGIIAEKRRGDFEILHCTMLQALSAACTKRHCALIHLSALGSASTAPTAYWASKGRGEEWLAAQDIACTILRPSLVFSPQGASSKLFLGLATLPLVLLPGANVPVQPVSVDDLAALIVALVRMRLAGETWPSRIDVAGPRKMTLAQYISLLRQAMGAPPAWLGHLPFALAQPIARVSAWLRLPMLAPEPLTMLAASQDGRLCPDNSMMCQILGRSPRDPAGFATPSLRPAAIAGWAYPALTVIIAWLWLYTAYVSWFAWPHEQSHAWLSACAIPPGLHEFVLATASITDAALGTALLTGLVRARRWHGVLWPVQIGLVAGYTLLMTVFLPQFWAHPFGPLSKNLPLLLLFCVMWRLR